MKLGLAAVWRGCEPAGEVRRDVDRKYSENAVAKMYGIALRRVRADSFASIIDQSVLQHDTAPDVRSGSVHQIVHRRRKDKR